MEIIILFSVLLILASVIGLTQRKAKTIIPTKYCGIIEINSVTYPVYKGELRGFYIIRKSSVGIEYKQYLKEKDYGRF